MSEVDELLKKISIEDNLIHSLYADKLQVNDKIDRTLVSFQANKARNGNRWCKYNPYNDSNYGSKYTYN